MNNRYWIKEKLNKRRILSLPYFSLLIVLIVTVGTSYLFYTNANNNDAIRFENETVKINARLENELYKRTLSLMTTRHTIESGELNSLKNLYSLNEVQNVGVLEYSGKNQLNSSSSRTIDLNDLKFKQTGINNFILETIDNKELSRSVKEDKLIISETQFEIGPGESNNGYVMLLPFFENEQNNESSSKALSGFVYHSFGKQNLLESMYRKIPIDDIGFQLSLNGKEIIEQGSPETFLKREFTFETLGISWSAKYQASPAFFYQSSVGLTVLLPIIGVLVGILIFGFLRFEDLTKVELAEIAEELNIAKEEKAILLESEQKARKTAESSNRLKDEFISMVSHEIRTPLNAIAGWANILKSENITEDTKQKALETINRNIKTQSDIIDELLLFSTLNSKDRIVKNDLTKISGIVEEAIEEIIPFAEEKDIHLLKDNRLNGEKIYCDKKKISKALHNLLENAIKFTPRGGEVELVAEKSESSINLKIKDSGKGIKKEFLPHIFDKFRQADSSTTREFSGLGLGLAISQQIIKLHGGEIKVFSNGENKGTEFNIKLPKNN